MDSSHPDFKEAKRIFEANYCMLARYNGGIIRPSCYGCKYYQTVVYEGASTTYPIQTPKYSRRECIHPMRPSQINEIVDYVVEAL